VPEAVTFVQGRRRSRPGFWILSVVVAFSSFVAFVLTDARCGAIDLATTATDRSSYCRALGAPGTPHSLSGLVLMVVVFGLPTICALGGALASLRLTGGATLRTVGICCAVGVGVSLILIVFAHANYAPVD
jgi:hypothetical protein